MYLWESVLSGLIYCCDYTDKTITKQILLNEFMVPLGAFYPLLILIYNTKGEIFT